MPRFNQLGYVKYNNDIQYNDFNRVAKNNQFYKRLARARPVVMDQSYNELAVLDEADVVMLHQEENGEDTLDFEFPFNSPKRKFIRNENLIQLTDKEYVIRMLGDTRDMGNQKVTTVYCERSFYSLSYADPLEIFEWRDTTPKRVMQDILKGTGWRVGKVNITTKRNMTEDDKKSNRLKALKRMANLWDGRLIFHDDSKTVDLLSEDSREDSGAAIAYRKNMQEIEATYDTTDLITRLYLYGKNGVTIDEANDGKKYIENYQYTTNKRVRQHTDERFTNPYSLKEKGETILEKLSVPRSSYRVKASDFSYLSGLSHEQIGVGLKVWLFDQELGLDLVTHISAWDYNVLQPEDTELVLEWEQPGIEALLETVSDHAEYLESEDAVDQDQIMDLMVFNYLVNSRADDGFSYWTNNGWSIDSTGGHSGSASFLCQGAFDVEKTLTQEVWPSHRDAYTLSMQVSTENLKKGPEGKIGVEVVVHYDDDTSETQFVPLV